MFGVGFAFPRTLNPTFSVCVWVFPSFGLGFHFRKSTLALFLVCVFASSAQEPYCLILHMGFPFLWFGFSFPKVIPKLIFGMGIRFFRTGTLHSQSMYGFSLPWFGFSLPRRNPKLIFGMGFPFLGLGFHCQSHPTLARGAASVWVSLGRGRMLALTGPSAPV